MESLIVVNWKPEKSSNVIHLKESYNVGTVIDLLVNSLMMLVQTCTENEHKLKDFELLRRIKNIIDNGQFEKPETELMIIIKADFEKEWINISFPATQGFLPIELVSDIISYSLFQIISDDKDPEDLRNSIYENMHYHFVKIDNKPISIDEDFLKK